MERLDPIVLLGGIAALCVLAVPVITVWKTIFGGYAKKSELQVMQDSAKERREEVDKALENRRRDVIDLHQKIDEHAKEDREIHGEMLRELRGIGSAVARIEGRLEK